MKMEILAVQSQFQNQFSVMQPKVKGKSNFAISIIFFYLKFKFTYETD